jgi:large repetitive protein
MRWKSSDGSTASRPGVRRAAPAGGEPGMTAAPQARSGRRRAAVIGVLGTALVLLGVSPLAGRAFAESATSPTGMIAVTVPPPVVAGTASTYTVTVTNTTSTAFQGPAGIVASGTMPAGVTVQRITGCANFLGGGNQGSSFLCNMPNLAPGASETATFSLLASAAGSYQIPFNAAAEVPVPGAPGEFTDVADSVTLPVTVQAAVAVTDIQVTGSSNNGSPNVGSTFTYTFQVKDNGPQSAPAVTFDDTLPAAIQLGSTLTASIGSCTANAASGSIHCNIGTLSTGQQSVITFSATPTVTGTFGNTATTAFTGTDTHPANNSVTVTVQPR